MTTYDQYSRAELIELIYVKNKKIDSQRAMLHQLRFRRNKLQSKVADARKVLKDNANLKSEVEKLNQRVSRLLDSGSCKAWSLKEYAPAMMDAIMGYHKARKEGYFTSNEMSFFILGYQKEFFTLSDIQTFYKKWGRNPDWNWRNDLRACCNAGFLYSDKIERQTSYYLSLVGRERLQNLLKGIFHGT